MALRVILTDEQKIKVSLGPTTQGGQPAKVDGAPTWVVKSGDVTLEVAEDGMSAEIISGTDGESIVSISADADLGAGIVTISDTINVTVIAPMAANLGASAGSPELKNPPATAPAS